MDFKSMKRKDLQSLCKKHGLPANTTNSRMIDSLSSILQEKMKPKGCLKGSGGSSAEDLGVIRGGSKKVTFVFEDEGDDADEEFRLNPVGKSERKLTRRSPSFAPELDKGRKEIENGNHYESAKNGEEFTRRTTRSRGLAESVLQFPENKKAGTECVRQNAKPSIDKEEKAIIAEVPSTRSLRNRVVVVARGDEGQVTDTTKRYTHKKKNSGKVEQKENVAALLKEDDAVGKKNHCKRSREGDTIKDEPPPRRSTRNHEKLEETVATEEVDVGRSKKRRRGGMDALSAASVVNEVTERVFKHGCTAKRSRGNTLNSKAMESVDVTRPTRSSSALSESGNSVSAVGKSDQEGKAVRIDKSENEGKRGDSATLMVDSEVVPEPIRRSASSYSTLLEDETSLHVGGNSIKGCEPGRKGKSQKQVTLLTASEVVALPLKRSTRSSSLQEEETSTISVGESVEGCEVVGKRRSQKQARELGSKGGVSKLLSSVAEVVADHVRRSTRHSSSNLVEEENSLPVVGKSFKGVEAAGDGKSQKEANDHGSTGGGSSRSTASLACNEVKVEPVGRSTCSSSYLLENRTSPVVEDSVKEGEASQKGKPMKQDKCPASEGEVSISTRGHGDAVRKGTASKKPKAHILEQGNSTASLLDNEVVTTPVRRSTRCSSKVSADSEVLKSPFSPHFYNEAGITPEKISTSHLSKVLVDSEVVKSPSSSHPDNESTIIPARRSTCHSSKVPVHSEVSTCHSSKVPVDSEVLKCPCHTHLDDEAVTMPAGRLTHHLAKGPVDQVLKSPCSPHPTSSLLEDITEAHVKAKSSRKELINVQDGQVDMKKPFIGGTDSAGQISVPGRLHTVLTNVSNDVDPETVAQMRESPESVPLDKIEYDTSLVGSIKDLDDVSLSSHIIDGHSSLVEVVNNSRGQSAFNTVKVSSEVQEDFSGKHVCSNVDADMKGKTLELYWDDRDTASAPVDITSSTTVSRNASVGALDMDGLASMESQNVISPPVPPTPSEEQSTAFHTEISTLSYLKCPDSAVELDPDHEDILTMNVTASCLPCKSSDELSLASVANASPGLDSKDPISHLEVCGTTEVGLQGNEAAYISRPDLKGKSFDGLLSISDADVSTEIDPEEPELKVEVEAPMEGIMTSSGTDTISLVGTLKDIDVSLSSHIIHGHSSLVEVVNNSRGRSAFNTVRVSSEVQEDFSGKHVCSNVDADKKGKTLELYWDDRDTASAPVDTTSSIITSRNASVGALDMDGLARMESQNVISPPVPSTHSEEQSTTLHAEISTLSYLKCPDSAVELDPDHEDILTMHVTASCLPCKSSDELSLAYIANDSPRLDSKDPISNLGIHGTTEVGLQGNEAAFISRPDLKGKSFDGLLSISDADVSTEIDPEEPELKVEVEGPVEGIMASSGTDTILMTSNPAVCSETFCDYNNEESDSKVQVHDGNTVCMVGTKATNTDGLPLSCKSAGVLFPTPFPSLHNEMYPETGIRESDLRAHTQAMSKVSYASSIFLVESSGTLYKTLEDSLTAERDARSISSIQRSCDDEVENCKVDTDTILSAQLAPEEGNPGEKIEVSSVCSESPSCIGLGIIKETWVSPIFSVMVNNDAETEGGTSGAEKNGELRPSSPSETLACDLDTHDHIKEQGSPSSTAQLTLEECDAGEKIEASIAGSESQPCIGLEVMNETWIPSTLSVTVNENAETECDTRGAEKSGDELMPYSPSENPACDLDKCDHMKECGSTTSTEETVGGTSTLFSHVALNKSDFTLSWYDKDPADAEGNSSDSFDDEFCEDSREHFQSSEAFMKPGGPSYALPMESKDGEYTPSQIVVAPSEVIELISSVDHGSSIQTLAASGKSVKQLMKEDALLVVNVESTEMSDLTIENRSHIDAILFGGDTKAMDLSVSVPCDGEHFPRTTSETPAPLSYKGSVNKGNIQECHCVPEGEDLRHLSDQQEVSLTQSLGVDSADWCPKSALEGQKALEQFNEISDILRETVHTELADVDHEISPELGAIHVEEMKNIELLEGMTTIEGKDGTVMKKTDSIGWSALNHFDEVCEKRDDAVLSQRIEDLPGELQTCDFTLSPLHHSGTGLPMRNLEWSSEDQLTEANSGNASVEEETLDTEEFRCPVSSVEMASWKESPESVMLKANTLSAGSLGLASSTGTYLVDSQFFGSKATEEKEIGEKIGSRLQCNVHNEFDSHRGALSACGKFNQEERTNVSSIKIEGELEAREKDIVPSTSETTYPVSANTFECKVLDSGSWDANNANNDNDIVLEENSDCNLILASTIKTDAKHGLNHDISMFISRMAQDAGLAAMSDTKASPPGDHSLGCLEKAVDLCSRECLATGFATSSSRLHSQDGQSSKCRGIFECCELASNVEEASVAPDVKLTFAEDLFCMDSEAANSVNDGARVGQSGPHEQNIGQGKCGDFSDSNTAGSISIEDGEKNVVVLSGRPDAKWDEACTYNCEISPKVESLSGSSAKPCADADSQAIHLVGLSEDQEERRPIPKTLKVSEFRKEETSTVLDEIEDSPTEMFKSNRIGSMLIPTAADQEELITRNCVEISATNVADQVVSWDFKDSSAMERSNENESEDPECRGGCSGHALASLDAEAGGVNCADAQETILSKDEAVAHEEYFEDICWPFPDTGDADSCQHESESTLENADHSSKSRNDVSEEQNRSSYLKQTEYSKECVLSTPKKLTRNFEPYSGIDDAVRNKENASGLKMGSPQKKNEKSAISTSSRRPLQSLIRTKSEH